MGSLAWEAFPRSGSTWISQSLRLAFPGYEQVSGEHRFSNLRNRNNLIVPVRNPLDSVVSWMLFTENKSNAEPLLDWYIRFYTEILANASRIHVTVFDLFISDVNTEMNFYADRFNLSSPKYINTDCLYKTMKKKFLDHIPRQKNYEAENRIRDTVKSCNNYFVSVEKYKEVVEISTFDRIDK